MITKLYVDNFRCLVNFNISLTRNQLWLGNNGTGKSSVLDVLRAVQSVLAGNHVDDIFATEDLTAWQTKSDQTFRVEIKSGNDCYEYELLIQHERKNRRRHIDRERLVWNGSEFYRFAYDQKTGRHEARLFRLNRDTSLPEEGTHFGADWHRSIIPSIAEREDNGPLVRFREHVERWLIVLPVPTMMKPLAEEESRSLDRYAANFADWYRHLYQEESMVWLDARQVLGHVLDGFESLDLKETGDARRLVSRFRVAEQDFSVDFGRLSDGQRQLIALYVMLGALKTKYRVLLIDEPDNFVSLREIQPWVAELGDLCSDAGRQAVIISHHPATINALTDGTELWFGRDPRGHVLVGPYPKHEGLSAAETMARGWDGE